ncbi:transposable element Tcb1 transposase [Trichonephila clavipes]|nr:transposable element Tcb1 transposase [Trichonephila clavipes]
MSAYEPNSRHLREVLIFCFNMKKPAAEAHRMCSQIPMVRPLLVKERAESGFNASRTVILTSKTSMAFDKPEESHPSGIVVSDADCDAVGPGFESRVKHGCLRYNPSLLCDVCFTLTSMEISSRVGRNQITVIRICNRWMQEGTTDRRGPSHPPQCATSREDRQIVRMAMTDRSVTSRTQSGLSAKRQLLGIPLMQNHRRLRHQWCDERRMWVVEWNEVVFTDEPRLCLQHHDGRIRVCTLNSQRYISKVLEPVVLPYLRGLATVIFQQDNARPHVARIVQRFFVNHQIELLPGRLAHRIFR